MFKVCIVKTNYCMRFNTNKPYLKLTLLMLLSFWHHSSYSETITLAIEHKNAELYAYAISTLDLIVKNIPGSPHKLKVISPPSYNHNQLFNSLTNQNFDIAISGYSDKKVLQASIIKFPISRGLLGHRIFIIKKENEDLINTFKTLPDLIKNFTIGSGHGWLDTDVFKYHNFNVEVAEYNLLWKMLSKNRFLGFNRGLHEGHHELSLFKSKWPSLKVHETLVIKYPFDYFFYVSKNNTVLYKKLNASIKNLERKGLLKKHFFSHPSIINSLKSISKSTRVFEIENPYFNIKISKEYWYNID
jgi:hypothetical protein